MAPAATSSASKPPAAASGTRRYTDGSTQAERGDASAFSSHLATTPQSDPLPGLAVNCIDCPRNVKTYEDFAAMTRRGRAIAPHTQGAGEAWLGITGCLRWPVPLANPPHRAAIRGAPPILLVSATHDPSTSYVWAQRVHRQIHGTVLLTRHGDGHTSSWLGPRSRTNNAIVDYLITGKAPRPNTVYPD